MQRRAFLSLLLAAPLVSTLDATTGTRPRLSPPTSLPVEPWRTDPETLARWRRAARHPILETDDPLLARLSAAVRANLPLRFRYHGGTTPAALRKVTPGHLYSVEGFPGAYLSGYCHVRRAERTFLVSRILLLDSPAPLV